MAGSTERTLALAALEPSVGRLDALVPLGDAVVVELGKADAMSRK